MGPLDSYDVEWGEWALDSDYESNSDITSFAVPPYIGPGFDEDEEEAVEEGIWQDLRNAIATQVKNDGITKSRLSAGQNPAYVAEDAVEQIFYDVAEFYSWYFNPDDDRKIFQLTQKTGASSTLKRAVAPTVADNLEAMKEVGEIPDDQDPELLQDMITDALVDYILNWEDWYYDRMEDELVDDYFYQKEMYDSIYLESDYGDYSNIDGDDEQYDGYSGVPFIGEEDE